MPQRMVKAWLLNEILFDDYTPGLQQLYSKVGYGTVDDEAEY